MTFLKKKNAFHYLEIWLLFWISIIEHRERRILWWQQLQALVGNRRRTMNDQNDQNVYSNQIVQ